MEWFEIEHIQDWCSVDPFACFGNAKVFSEFVCYQQLNEAVDVDSATLEPTEDG